MKETLSINSCWLVLHKRAPLIYETFSRSEFFILLSAASVQKQKTVLLFAEFTITLEIYGRVLTVRLRADFQANNAECNADADTDTMSLRFNTDL